MFDVKAEVHQLKVIMEQRRQHRTSNLMADDVTAIKDTQ